MRIVLDTNCLIRIIPRKSQWRLVWDSFIQRKFFLCVSNEILNEYHEILSKLASADVADNIISVISNSPNTLFFDPRFRFYIINSDPDDNKFVDCAIISQAKYIVSDDHHFDEAKKNEFPKVDVVSLRKFAEILANATNH